MGKIQVMEHPLIQHKIGIIRRTENRIQRFQKSDFRDCHADVL